MVHVIQRHTLEQGHPLAQAFFVIGDLPAHGGFGDGRHFGFASGSIGNLIHTLDVDQSRVHVKRDQFEIRQA